ncbi:MAG: four helix bundle protein [Bdellovibrionota bacterium]
MKNFRTYQVAVEFYRLTTKLTLPRHLRDQLSRASSSIVLNLAEGAGRFGTKDQKRFYHIAFGSLRECQAIIDLVSNEESELNGSADKLAAHIYKLIRS